MTRGRPHPRPRPVRRHQLRRSDPDAHLVERHGTDGDLRWAIAGRDADKLGDGVADTGADGRADRRRCRRRAATGRRWSRRPRGRLHGRARMRSTARARRRRGRGGHRLLRPDRRAAVDAADDRRPPGRGGGERRPHRPRLRVRLDPVGPRRLVHPAAGRSTGSGALHPDRACA